jgi:membrane-bound serine protease (ClpP class)
VRVSGDEALIGSVGEMLDDASQEGWARVHGENWRVRPDSAARRGQQVRVLARDGLVLRVHPLATDTKGE